MKILHIDFETFSRCNLIAHGAYTYAQHISTGVHCMGYAFDEEEPRLWLPSEPFPQDVTDHIKAGGMLHCHNAQFERLIFWYVVCPDHDVPEPALEQFYCTAAQARCRALPANLDDLGRCLKLSLLKDKRGKELIKLLCIPNKETGAFNRDPELLQELYDYCLQDVRVERLAANCTPGLTDDELATYHAMETVNDAGLMVDVELAKAAGRYAALELEEICEKLRNVTGGAIQTPRQYQKIKDFILDRSDDRARKAMTVVKTDRKTGLEERKVSFGKDNRRRLLEIAEADPDFLPSEGLQVIGLVDEAGRSSVSKFENMMKRADIEDHRVRGAYICFGAGQTGRASSMGLQVHNMPRNTAKDPDKVRRWIIEDRELPGVMDTLSSMLRPAILAAPGHSFVCGDWAAIEARVLPWISKSNGGSYVLDVFEEVDADPDAPDLYMIEAGNLFNKDPKTVTKNERAIGKVEVLALGYQGGYRAFQAMARGYGITVSDEEAERIKDTWRFNNQWAVDLWKDLNQAALAAVFAPGTEVQAGRVSYYHAGDGHPLYCMLPSGRALSYPQVRMEEGDYGPELTAVKGQWKPKADETDWPRIKLYGGLLAENITQAASADILFDAVRKAVAAGLNVVGTTHDELLVETANPDIDKCKLETIMLDTPAWAAGLPMAAELWTGKRYRK